MVTALTVDKMKSRVILANAISLRGNDVISASIEVLNDTYQSWAN